MEHHMGMDMNTTGMPMHMHMMKMYFHFSTDEYILFKEWHTTSLLVYIFSCVGVAAIAFVFECIHFGRAMMSNYTFEAAYSMEESCCVPDGLPSTEVKSFGSYKVDYRPFTRESMFAWRHILSTVILFAQLLVDYSLMMVVMTYNVPIVLAVVAGHTVAFFIISPLLGLDDDFFNETCCN